MKIKYPRTPHLPWSMGRTNDDKVLKDTAHLNNVEVIATLKMDGENTTLYRDGMHARSTDSLSREWQTWVRGFHATLKADIPEGWRVCGENLFAVHSIEYRDLPSYFLGFSIWNENSICLDWDETLGWFELLGITPVESFYRGPFNSLDIILAYTQRTVNAPHEGYVVRRASDFHYKAFGNSVAKFVRANHVQADKHWTKQAIRINGLKGQQHVQSPDRGVPEGGSASGDPQGADPQDR